MKKLICLVLFLVVFTLSSCDLVGNDQISEAIDACKDDPECYVIIDETIEDELESRGITGGIMTSIELEEVYLTIESLFGSDYDNLLTNSRTINFIKETVMVAPIQSMSESDIYDYLDSLEMSNDPQYIEMLNILDIRDKNPDKLQYFFYNESKYMLYKKSNSQFVLEYYGDEYSSIFVIDIELEAVYNDGGSRIKSGNKNISELIDFYHQDFFYEVSDDYIVNFNRFIDDGDDILEYYRFSAIDLDIGSSISLLLSRTSGNQYIYDAYFLMYTSDRLSWSQYQVRGEVSFTSMSIGDLFIFLSDEENTNSEEYNVQISPNEEFTVTSSVFTEEMSCFNIISDIIIPSE